ncbi:putative malate dehydrogenase protein [Daldinia childiae]|uniref:putative malate dehydrogenase protein n=1 Tax=Daldinia childiae TaxID=326645 RepID=UPI0014449FE1|nr:putative malate dehydrogenase protein [Daldinia childiae]KAF3058376.1 putative malate dehydrogenase protein [Daldinia childiae]
MHPRSLFIILSALTLTSASPLRRRCGSRVSNSTTPTPTDPSPALPVAAVPTLPTTGSGTQLAGPDAATLKHILVGHGIQNYTCSAEGATAASFGALAVVWEITDLYPGASPSSLSVDDFDAFASTVLRKTDMPVNLAAEGGSPFPAPADLTVEGIPSPLKFLGHHFFDEANTPTFDLSGADDGELFKGKKDAGIPAPSDADKGADPATGAVDWLRLSDKGTSTGVSLVYRVLTAGGNPELCGSPGQTQSIPYAAQYWIYEN